MEGSRLSDCTAAASGAVSAPAPAPAPPGQEEVTPFLPLRMGLQNAGSFFAPLLPTSLRSVRLPAAPALPVPPSRSSFPSQCPSLSRCPSPPCAPPPCSSPSHCPSPSQCPSPSECPSLSHCPSPTAPPPPTAPPLLLALLPLGLWLLLRSPPGPILCVLTCVVLSRHFAEGARW